MKKIILVFLLLVFCDVYCQNLEVEYKYEVKRKALNKTFSFPSILYLNNKQSLYVVQFGIENQLKNEDVSVSNKNGVFSVVEKGGYYHKIYYEVGSMYFIEDKINGKKYIFKDDCSSFIYTKTDEYKEVDKVKLTKATTDFRGRKYVIWYDEHSNIKGGPWKFKDLPGLVYEIYDTEGVFKWTLQNMKFTNVTITNPFENYKGEVLSYKKYPKLKYGLSEKLLAKLKKHGIDMKENERDGLEIVFEWEK